MSYPYETSELANGFRAYLIKAGSRGQIAALSIVRTGSRDEVEGDAKAAGGF